MNRNSVVIMDNASVHHLDKITGMIARTGALLRFLPPYSPELNLIKHVFSKVKAFLNGCATTFLKLVQLNVTRPLSAGIVRIQKWMKIGSKKSSIFG